MPPIRRYLRITKFSVLEVRIYLHKPSDASWLLSSRDDVLSRIIQEIRPKVLPKLREENEIAKRKGSKKKRNIKDVVATSEFEVAIFLKETKGRHSLLTKEKEFGKKERIRGNGGKLTGWLNTSDNPIRIDEDEVPPEVLREEGEGDAVMALNDIPEAPAKKRKTQGEEDGEEEDALFVSSSDEEFFATQRAKPSKKRKRAQTEPEIEDAGDEDKTDDKKKLGLNTSYDGFSIYGRILCLIVTRKGKKAATAQAPVGGSQMMEQWVSTQAAQDAGGGDDGDG